MKYGDWATEKYGSGPVRVDALEFMVERVKQLEKDCDRLGKDCLPPNERVMPAAFVTFTSRRCQARSPPFLPPPPPARQQYTISGFWVPAQFCKT